ncbi:MAG: sel1 repeat family protein [Aquificaceae bacterium]|nr:sel1 repeat family protein [Aquificaceae bacterium]
MLLILSSCGSFFEEGLFARVLKVIPIGKNPDKLRKECISYIEKGEYLKALKVCEKACKLKMKDACLRQAYIMDRHIQGDIRQVVEIYSQLCSDGHGEACFNLGGIYERGRAGINKDINLALMNYKRGCDLGISPACTKVKEYELPSPPPPEYIPRQEETYKPKGEPHHESDEALIRKLVESYHRAVEEKNIEEALDFYVSHRKPEISVAKLTEIANYTEYYVIEEVNVLSIRGRFAEVYVRVRQKKTASKKEEVWEGVWTVEKENDEWKIVKTPGRRIL